MSKQFILWKKEFETGIANIDEQHKKLVAMINELYEAFVDKEHKERVDEIVDKMTEYTVYHFSTEEDYFRKIAFPDLIAHKKMHQEFVEKVAVFKENIVQSKTTLTFKVLSFLQDWLLNHIQYADKAYVPALKKYLENQTSDS